MGQGGDEIKHLKACCVVYRGQQAYDKSGAQRPIGGGRSYLPLDDILPPLGKDMINDIREASDNDAGIRRQIPRCFPTIPTGFQTFEMMLQRMIIRHH